MALKTQHRLNGSIVKPPIENEEINISVQLDNVDGEDFNEIKPSTTNFSWYGETAEFLKNYFTDGQTGLGIGILEGVDHDIEFSDENVSQTLNLLLDLASASYGSNDLGEFYIQAESKSKQDLTWQNEVFDGITFERLFSEGKITKSDYIFMPYVLSTVPNYREAFLTVLTFSVVKIELDNVVQRLSKGSGEAATVIDSIGGALELIFTIIYLVGLIITLVTLILDFVDLIIQRIKYMPGMRVNDLIRIGAQEAGLSYQSPVLESAPLDKLVIFPPQLGVGLEPSDNRIKGFFNPASSNEIGYYQGSFGQLLRAISTVFYLKRSIQGQTLRLIPFDQVPQGASFQMPDVDQPVFRTNAPQLIRNLNLAFPTDVTDKNTIDNYAGTDVNVAYDPIKVNDQRNILISGGITRTFEFARLTRKNELNTYEKIADTLLTGVNAVLNVLVGIANGVVSIVNGAIKIFEVFSKVLNFFGIGKGKPPFPSIPKVKNPNLGNLIQNRVGIAQIEDDLFTVHKLALVDISANYKNNKLSTLNSTVLNARNIYNTYWNTVNEQKIIREYRNIPMTLLDLQNVINERALKKADGTVVRVLSIDFNGELSGGLANFVIEERTTYTTNLKTTITQSK